MFDFYPGLPHMCTLIDTYVSVLDRIFICHYGHAIIVHKWPTGACNLTLVLSFQTVKAIYYCGTWLVIFGQVVDQMQIIQNRLSSLGYACWTDANYSEPTLITRICLQVKKKYQTLEPTNYIQWLHGGSWDRSRQTGWWTRSVAK